MSTTPLNFDFPPDEDLGPTGEGDLIPFANGDGESHFLVGADFGTGVIDPESIDPISFPENGGPDLGDSHADGRTGGAGGKRKQKRSPSAAQLRRKKKPKGMPKRPLSAYNLYFQSERAKILEAAETGQGDRLGFEGLGKIIGSKWRVLPASERKQYEKLADKDSVRYRKEMEEYNKKKNKRVEDSEQLSYENLMKETSVDSRSFPDPPSSLGLVDRFPPTAGTPPLAAGERRRHSVDGAPTSPFRRYSGGQSHPSYHHEHPHPYEQHEYAARDAGPRSPARSHPPAPEPPMPFQAPPTPHDAAGLEVPHSLSTMLSAGEMPVPEGMEVVLPDRNGVDRRYRVHYTCYPMTREAADRFMEDWSRGMRRPPPPAPHGGPENPLVFPDRHPASHGLHLVHSYGDETVHSRRRSDPR